MQLGTVKIKIKKKWHIIFLKDGHHQICHSACPPYRVRIMLFPFERWGLFPTVESRQGSNPRGRTPSDFCSGITECHSASTGLFWDICSWNPAVMQNEAQACLYGEKMQGDHKESSSWDPCWSSSQPPVSTSRHLDGDISGVSHPPVTQSHTFPLSPGPAIHIFLVKVPNCLEQICPPNSCLNFDPQNPGTSQKAFFFFFWRPLHFGIICYTTIVIRTLMYLE